MLLSILLFLTCLAPFVTLGANILMFRNLRRLPEVKSKEPERWPKLSIIIPACNEGDTIGPALTSVLNLDYPDLEFILIDDRSTDATGAAMDAAAKDRRVRVIHNQVLPEGWLGKVHALELGTREATGEIILFTDADVIFAKDALRSTVSYFLENQLDHLCVIPHVFSRSLAASMSIAAALRGIALSQRPWHIHNPKRKETIGGGAFNMVRRSFFVEKTPGFEWLRMEVADDIGLAHMMKQSGGKPSALIAYDRISVEWYSTFAGAVKGLEKNGFAQLARYSLLRGAFLSVVILYAGLGPFAALFSSVPWVQAAGVAAILVSIGSSVALARWLGVSVAPTVLSIPLGDILVSYVVFRATILGVVRGGLTWRGTLYPTEKLRAGMRIKF